MTGSRLLIRDSTDDDTGAIHAIYAHHVVHGTGSFEYAPPDLDTMRQRRADVLRNGLPSLVATRDGLVIGWCSANFFRLRPAFRFLVEDSIYIAPGAVGQGVGRQLLTTLIARCESIGIRQMLAVIGDSANTGSIGLHAACGFRFAGVMPASGWKFDRWLDTVMMQRPLGDGDRSAPV